MAKLHPRKLTAGYPKLWVGQGDSFEIWHFFGMLNLWGVEVFFRSQLIGVAVFDQRNLTLKNKSQGREWF